MACSLPAGISQCRPIQIYKSGGIDYHVFRLCDDNGAFLAIYQLCSGVPSGVPVNYTLAGVAYTPVGTISDCAGSGGGGDATAANQVTGNTSLSSINTKTPALGQAAMAASTPVVIASNQSAVPVSGTFFQATQPVSAAALPLPSGASISAKQPALGVAGTASTDVISVQGIAGMTALKVDGSAVTQPVSASALPLPSGAATAANQATNNTSVASIDTKTPALGQAVAGSSTPVVLPVAQITTLTPPAAITGFATETTLAKLDGTTITTVTASIANGTSLSPAVNLSGRGITRLYMSAAWTAAGITFQVSADNVTFYNLYDQYGAEYSLVVAQGNAVILNPADFFGINYIKVRSGTTGTPVNQGAQRDLILITRPV